MVLGLLATITPKRAAQPDRDRTCASYPCGSSIAMPVGSTSGLPGRTATRCAPVYIRSTPDAPADLYSGIGIWGTRRRILTCIVLFPSTLRVLFYIGGPVQPRLWLRLYRNPAMDLSLFRLAM